MTDGLQTTQAIELEKLVADIAADIQSARIPLPPPERERSGDPAALQGWAFEFMNTLANGRGWQELELGQV